MDFIELVNRRYSVRDYDTRAVSKEDINACLEAARLAPSACNSQPWQFIVADDPESKGKVSKAMLSGIYGMNSFINKAPCLVVVMTDSAKWFTKVCNVLRDTKTYLVDVGIACEHFALAAAERGIGTCFLGWFNERAVKKALGLPAAKRVHIIISMGYPAAGSEAREKNRKPLFEMSSYV